MRIYRPERASIFLCSTISTAFIASVVGISGAFAGPINSERLDQQGAADGRTARSVEERRQIEYRASLTDSIIVKYRDENLAAMSGDVAMQRANQSVNSLASSMGVSMRHSRVIATGAQLAKVETRGVDMEALARRIAAQPGVEYAEVDRLWQPMATPNDTRYNEQWHYFESTAGLNLPSAWDTTEGAGSVVAVLDTGYRPHADLNGNILQGYDMIDDTFMANDGDGRDSDARDPGDAVTAGECGNGKPEQDQDSSWHGTHVAGTVAAVTDNGTGVAGVAGDANVVPVRVLGKCGGRTSDIADGIIWASGGSVSGTPSNSNPANVINMSLGGPGSCPSTTQAAIDTARNNGSTVVVAAGNSNDNANNYTPASCNGVVTVAALNRDGDRAYYSNTGTVVDVAAPGGQICDLKDGVETPGSLDDCEGGTTTPEKMVLSTHNDGATSPGNDSYAQQQGTSMAAPHVAGVAALVTAVDGSLTPDQVESLLRDNTRAIPGTCSGCGTGLVDAAATVTAANGGGGGGGGGGSDTELTNGVAETDLSGGDGEELHFYMDVPSDATDLSFSISGGSGDADLYVQFGSEPTTDSYDCRPWQGGNDETCDISNVQAGTYYVMVRGYNAFSGVDLVGSYTDGSGGGGGGGGSTCPTGYESFSGTLSDGGSEYQPDGDYYHTSTSGTHAGELSGPSSADFDLELQKWDGSGWSTVDSSTSSDSEESISYSGSGGYYIWQVESYSGSGDYTFCLSRP